MCAARTGWRRPALPPAVPLAELTVNPVVLTETDKKGRLHHLSIERQKSGLVRVTCDCDQSRAQGWCEQGLSVLLLQDTAATRAEPELKVALERVVTGSAIAEDARSISAARGAFAEALKTFDDERPEDVEGENLAVFTELASELAASAAELEDAVSRLKRAFRPAGG